MPTRNTAWPAGTPAWVDATFDDITAAEKFYARLFGWDIHEGPAESGGYRMCLKNGHPAAAITPRMNDTMPSVWSTYFASDNVDETAARVEAAGGTVLMAPMDVMEAGRFAFFQDAEGGHFGAWQSGMTTGFEIFNEPGSVAWNDLMTRDLDGAQRFYANVFGFTFEPMGNDYVTFKRADGEVVGGMHLAAHLPDGVPANWLVHFAVADRDATISIVEELDGEVLATHDTPFGPEATVRGPEGEIFNIIALTEQAEQRQVP